MPYAVLEKEIERLDETQQNAVVLFVRFLLSQKAAAPVGGGGSRPRSPARKDGEGNPLSELVGCIGGSRRTDDVVSEMRGYDQWLRRHLAVSLRISLSAHMPSRVLIVC